MPPIDKIAHVLAGAAIAGLAVAYGFSPIIGFALSVFIGAIKELYDMTGKGTPEWSDFIATAAGGAIILPLAFPIF
jgi:hypothetical protein